MGGQLLSHKDEIEEINALQDFGAKTSRLRLDSSGHKFQSQQSNHPEQYSLLGEHKSLKVNTERKQHLTSDSVGKLNKRKKVPVEKEEFSTFQSGSIIARSEEDEKKPIVSQDKLKKIFQGPRDVDVARPVTKKFSKKVIVSSGSYPFLRKGIESEKEPMTDVQGYTNIARRNQRQSHMEEMAHAHIRDIVAECGDSGISVALEFNGPFHGVVYSKGHFNDPKCT